MKNKTVFVDLEETLVESWHDHRLCKLAKVQDFLGVHGRQVELFSFAVYNDADLDYFNRELKVFLEHACGLSFTKVHLAEDVKKAVQDFTRNYYESLPEFISEHGKSRAFEDFCLAQQKTDWEFVLLDDVVQNKTILLHDSNVKITFVKC